jgi:hypothetical protein
VAARKVRVLRFMEIVSQIWLIEGHVALSL